MNPARSNRYSRRTLRGSFTRRSPRGSGGIRGRFPVLGGAPQPFLPNASGLVWIDPRQLMYLGNMSGVHMGIVPSTVSRGGHRSIYFPLMQGGMAHRAASWSPRPLVGADCRKWYGGGGPPCLIDAVGTGIQHGLHCWSTRVRLVRRRHGCQMASRRAYLPTPKTDSTSGR